jgi:hypothetical protein
MKYQAQLCGKKTNEHFLFKSKSVSSQELNSCFVNAKFDFQRIN